jgi:acyl-coenzyme A synthetase/AMP-(fatty) acid ligase
VEQVLSQLPQIREVAVVGMPFEFKDSLPESDSGKILKRLLS